MQPIKRNSKFLTDIQPVNFTENIAQRITDIIPPYKPLRQEAPYRSSGFTGSSRPDDNNWASNGGSGCDPHSDIKIKNTAPLKSSDNNLITC
jgi:hypothetical protein